MENIDFQKRVEAILQEDCDYPPEAYDFVNAAVKYTIEALIAAGAASGRRHVNAAELLDGIVRFAQDQYGPMAAAVLTQWHLQKPTDIGRVVFNMVNAKLLSRSDNDQESDFDTDYNLTAKLQAPYRQQAQPVPKVQAPLID